MRTKNIQPINYAHVQMMINSKIATQDETAQADYIAKLPKRRAYYYEKLHTLIPRIIHHLKLYFSDKKNNVYKETLQSLQFEMAIFLKYDDGQSQAMGLTLEHQALLLQEL